MDLIRSAIKAVFYNFPIEKVAEVILYKNDSILMPLIVETIKWQNREFTEAEINLLGAILDNEWLSADDLGINVNHYSFLQRLPLLPELFSRKVLRCNSLSYPLVRFNELLRWRALSLLIGEDQLSIPYLAKYDLERNLERNDFCWCNTLNHDNIRINSILDENLADTHSHINAAIDIFEFNWLSLMNYPGCGHVHKRIPRDFLFSGPKMDYNPVNAWSEIHFTMSKWVTIAAAIRLLLSSSIKQVTVNLKAEDIVSAISDDLSYHSLSISLDDLLDSARCGSLHTSEGLSLDYAIREEEIKANTSMIISPYMIHYGERSFMYRWLKRYYGGDETIRNLASFFILYLMIKVKIRREFVQTNELNGFSNFQSYQGAKSYFQPPLSKSMAQHYREIAYRYAVQSSVGKNANHHLEARMTPEQIEQIRKFDYHSSIFGKSPYIKRARTGVVSFVPHFIKSFDNKTATGLYPRHYELRGRLKKQTLIIEREFLKNNSASDIPSVTGIDAASSELNCRPEVFAPFFRYLRFCGLSNFTFHAGEDYYDIIDGLRTIDEAIEFLGYSFGCRIGHGLALGEDAYSFYNSRHRMVVIPCQTLLDNLVWMRFKAALSNVALSPATGLWIESKFNELAGKLGYSNAVKSLSISDYWESMKLRGDLLKGIGSISVSSDCADVVFSQCSPGEKASDNAKELHKHYEYDADCRKEGVKPIMEEFPISFANDATQLQGIMLERIEKEGIVIETNPSSNIKIGRFDRYDNHPITKFYDTEKDGHHSIMVTINTDDKGVFATSLRNEYSLMALALRKRVDSNGELLLTDRQIEEYLRNIAHYSNITCFHC